MNIFSTRWPQINGSSLLKWDEKFDLDVWYVQHQSLLLDIKILFKAVIKVVQRKNINQGEGHSATRFDDYNPSKK